MTELPGLDDLGLPPRWVAAARSLGMTRFALAEDQFAQILTDGGGWGPLASRRSAVYFWLAENGEAYVGKATCVRRRLRQHFGQHRDMVAAAFVPVPPDALDREERRITALAEHGFRLRNVLNVKDSGSRLPLDGLLSRQEQAAFVQGGNPRAWIREARRASPLAEARQRPKLRRLAAFGDDDVLLRAPVSEFVLAAIPRPMATEGRYWSVTLFPAAGILARVNVGIEEVLTLHEDEAGFWARVLCPRALLPEAEAPGYRSGALASVLDCEGLADLLEDPARMAAVRTHALWLARHTTPLNLRSHCPGLFDPTVTDRWADGRGP